jgi:hypothetical protein
MDVAETLYFSRKAVDPRSDHEDKAFPAVWHGHHSIIEDNMPLDDALLPTYRAAERVFNLERALHVRNYGRGGPMDETVIPYFSPVNGGPTPSPANVAPSTRRASAL